MSSEGKKVCLITGGSRGIGLATALRFYADGYHVVVTGRNEARLKEAAQQIEASAGSGKVLTVCGDIGDAAVRQQIVDSVTREFGTVDVLVNNAGAAPLGDFDAIDESTFESVLETNIRAVFFLTQACWKLMKQGRGGTVVNVSSMAAIDPFPGFSIYGASKAWLELFTQALSTEGLDHQIRIYSVRPGAVETGLLRGLFPDFPADQCVQPAEVAERIWSCVSDPENHESGKAFTVAK